MRLFSAILSICAICISQSALRADDSEEGRRVHRAVLHLRDEVFDNCIAKFQMDFTNLRDDKIDLSGFGKYVFARRDSLALIDVTTTLRAGVEKDGRLRAESVRSRQNYVSKAHRCLEVSYYIVNTERKISSVSYDPKVTYKSYYHGLTNGVYLNGVLFSFGPSAENLADIVSSRVPLIKRNTGSSLVAQYTTEYGLIEATLERIANRDRLVEVRMTQSAKDVYTHLSKGATLAEIQQSVLRETPGGLTSVIQGFRISYDDTSKRPFSVFTVFNSYAAAGKTWKSDRILRLTDYQKCNSDTEIEALRIPIPEGERVGLMDPDKKEITYTYRNGDIVRQVDGASLEEVVTEERFHKKFVYVVVSIVGVALIAFGFRYAWKRWAVKSKGQSP